MVAVCLKLLHQQLAVYEILRAADLPFLRPVRCILQAP
ncbi:Uncharacterised protein [Segatella copri]|nr:Uncharacterised protein [Segatella copri]